MREENSTVKTMHGLNFFLALWVIAEGLSFHQGSLFRFFPRYEVVILEVY